MRYGRTLMIGTVSAFALTAGAAMAQDADTTVVDEVIVTGIRASLQQSLDTMRKANARIAGIPAEDVGQVPSSHVAEALVALPGITIDRAFGQGEKVSILGTDPALRRTLLNGQTVASADWFISDQPGRTFNYSLLAPQLVGKIEVYKSPEAYIDEGSIGGTVIVYTRKPLDLDHTTVSGQVSYLYNDRIESGDPQASILFGWKNEANTFGVIFSAQTSTENIRRDGIESYGTVTGRDYAYGRDGGGGSIYNTPIDWSLPAGPDGEWQHFPGTCVGECETTLLANLDAVGPNSISAHYFEQERKRDTLSLAVQFRPNEFLDIEFNALKVKAGYDNISHSMFSFNGNAYNALGRMTDVTVDGGVITSATFKNALSVYDLINRQATVETDSYDLKATWDQDNWFASAHIGTTKATGGTGRQVFGEFLNWSDYVYDISGTPNLTYTGANPFTNPEAFQIDGGYASPWHTDAPTETNWAPGWGGNIVTKPTWDEETYAQVDFGIRMDGPVNQFRFGAKRREHETGQSMSGVALASIAGYGNPRASQFDPRPLPGNYLSGFGNTGDLSERFTIDGWALADYILGGEWLAPWQEMPEPGTFNDSSFVANTWNVTEDVTALYGQADFEWNGFRGNLGVRYVSTESDSRGYQCTTGTVCAPDAYELVSVTKKYENVLPNLNIAYDFDNDLVLRFSAAKVISRPNYGDMSNYLWLGPQTLTGGGGNPDLDPYESTNFDVSAEWYFAANSILAGTLFYKDVGNYILTTTGTETHFNQTTQADAEFTISRPNNAGSATIKGLSLNYQQDLAYGFGVLANYTYSDAESDNGDPMPWTSKNQYSISPFYEAGPWSARVSYSWRSKYYTQVDRGNFLVTDEYKSLDASLGYQITERVGLKVDGMNLLDSEYYTYAQVDGVANTNKLVRGLYRTGRRLMLTASVAF